jgi:hypothetical protein
VLRKSTEEERNRGEERERNGWKRKQLRSERRAMSEEKRRLEDVRSVRERKGRSRVAQSHATATAFAVTEGTERQGMTPRTPGGRKE